MKLGELFKTKTVLSFEVFPPKRDGSLASVYKTVEELSSLYPDFISVTYGAGGSAVDGGDTVEIASWIKQNCGTESVAHLPCLHLSKDEAQRLLYRLQEHGIENTLALRGDRVEGLAETNAFRFANDLVRFIHENGDFHVLGACYPEGHPESGGLVADIRNLKRKVDAGADHLISQLFFDNQFFYRFRDHAAIAGIHVPIQAGIMPVVNKRQIERMVSLCGATLPNKFLKMMQRYERNEAAMRDAGIAYAVNQIVDLMAQGVDGIHLYTMNNPYIAKRICQSIQSLVSA